MVSVSVFSLCGLLLTFWGVPVSLADAMACYDKFNNPQFCYAPYENAAFGKPVEASNTCGVTTDVEYCLHNAFGSGPKNCLLCSDRSFPASAITDNDVTTWWQSETMLEGIQDKTVNLTLRFKKAVNVLVITLQFASSVPESFAIFKRTGENEPWVPYQFYSASCRKTYGVRDRSRPSSRFEASCTSEHSDIIPMSGGTVAFGPVDGKVLTTGRTDDLEDWLTATDIRIVLTRLNTFGDEAFGEPETLKSYYYAVSDLTVGARCMCNGHANECRNIQDPEMGERRECVCQHFTTGRDCEKCLPFYNDKPWRRATQADAYQCEACNCSGFSEECVFDSELYRKTGHGGRCINCHSNTAGNHCELCKENYFRINNNCEDCLCNTAGSTSLQCDENGQCPCKKGVEGVKCDRCSDGFFGSPDIGCQPCNCVVAGSQNNEPTCHSTTGQCACKQNVDGRRCDRCKPSFFDLTEDDPLGCKACFCHGHSTECTSADGYYSLKLMSKFKTGREGWTAITGNEQIETKYDGMSEKIGVASGAATEAVYFNAPSRFLGNQRFSYNQFLRFDMNTGGGNVHTSDVDVVLEGSDQTVTIPITGQSNPTPSEAAMSFAFRLHEHPDYQWKPTLQSDDFITLLSNLTALRIRATYRLKAVGFLDNVELTTASKEFGGDPATWIESCTCPTGYSGHSCETCSEGYTRDSSTEDDSGQCVPCQCNNHADHCDADNGRCICGDNTEGDHCEKCKSGFHGNATDGTKADCLPCECPLGSNCISVPNGRVMCVDFTEVKEIKEKILVLEDESEKAAAKYEQEQATKDFKIQNLEDKVERLTKNFNQLSNANDDLESDVDRLKKKTRDIVRTFKKVYGISV